MKLLDLFKKQPVLKTFSRWKELGTYNAVFTAFNRSVYASDIVRSCIRPLAEHTSKANARCSDPAIEKLLNYSPNVYMNGKDFLSKVRNYLEIFNTCFIMIVRDDKGKPTAFYPVPSQSFEALEYNKRLFIRFHFPNTTAGDLTVAWDDLAIIRKDYVDSDIAGNSNTEILDTLEMIHTTNQGIANAVKSTANLRGILKTTKMLSPEHVKTQRDNFVRDFTNAESGIAGIDSTMEFVPVNLNPSVVNFSQMKELRENVYRYFGVNDAIIMSSFTESQMDAFYDSRIEPFLVALSLELTRKVFTEREISFGNFIHYEANRLQFTSTNTKLEFVRLVDRGAMTPNEWRGLFNMAPIEGGDEPIRRLDTVAIKDADLTNTGGEEDGGDGSEE